MQVKRKKVLGKFYGNTCFGKKNKQDCITIVVAGMEPGTGATTLTMGLAVFAANILHKKTAYIEAGHSGTILSFYEVYTDEEEAEYMQMCMERGKYGKNEEQSGRSIFRVKKVNFFILKEWEQIKEIREKYEYIIVDYEMEHEKLFHAAKDCQLKIMTGSLSQWRVSHFVKSIRYMQEEGETNWIYAAPFADKQEVSYVKRKTGKNVMSIPYMENPFLLDKKNLDFFWNLTAGVEQ